MPPFMSGRYCDAAVPFHAGYGLDELASRDGVLALVEHNWYEQAIQAGLTQDAIRALDAVVIDALETRMHELRCDAIQLIGARHSVVVIASNQARFVRKFLRASRVRGVIEVVGADGASKVRKINSATRALRPSRRLLVRG